MRSLSSQEIAKHKIKAVQPAKKKPAVTIRPTVSRAAVAPTQPEATKALELVASQTQAVAIQAGELVRALQEGIERIADSQPVELPKPAKKWRFTVTGWNAYGRITTFEAERTE